MSDNNNKDDDGKIVKFPVGKERGQLIKRKNREEKSISKETEKQRKERERLEEEYRQQYKNEQAARARLQGKIAQNSAAGTQPFINWDKVPAFTRSIIAVFLVIQIAMSFLINDATRLDIISHYGFVPAYYSGAIPWSWSAIIAPFTTMIIHGGWIHVLVNSVMMVAMGVLFERQFGAKRTLIFFLLCGMAGNLVYFILNPALTAPVIGASGAISGLFGAAVMMMNSNGMTGSQNRGPLHFILLWISIIVIFGMLSADTAWQSHLGGFLGGVGLFQLWRTGKIRF